MNVDCPHCGHKIPSGRHQCPKCKRFMGEDRKVVVQSSILLSEVTSSDTDRIATGPWDVAWGEDFKTGKRGIVRTSVTLLAGSPGAGKSTLVLQIGNSAAQVTGFETLYLAAEEALAQIKARADRLALHNQNRIRMMSVMSGEGSVEEILAEHRPGLGILDSINGMAGEDKNLAVKIAHSIKLFSDRYQIPFIILSHINKGGDIAGLEALQHEVDSTMTFFPEGEETEGVESPRILHVEKNRNGRAFLSLPFLMTEKGLVPYKDEEDEEEDEEEERS